MKKTMKRVLSGIFATLMILTLIACAADTPAQQAPTPPPATGTDTPAAEAPTDDLGPITDPTTDPRLNQPMTMAFLPKLVGGAYFNRMYDGGLEFQRMVPGAEVFQVRPSTADTAAQNRIIQDLIAQGVDAILAVPVTPDQMEADAALAMQEGIIFIASEGEFMENVHWNVEAFFPEDFGELMGRKLAEGMGGEGEVVIFVSNLGAASHMAWATAAAELIRREFPNITIVTGDGPFIESGANATLAYEVANETLRAFPNARGFLSTAATDTPAIARAIEAAGMGDIITYVGVSMPSASRTFVESGVLDWLFIWDPYYINIVKARLASAVRMGHEVRDGDDLGVRGFHNIVVRGTDIYGEGWVVANADTIDNYDF